MQKLTMTVVGAAITKSNHFSVWLQPCWCCSREYQINHHLKSLLFKQKYEIQLLDINIIQNTRWQWSTTTAWWWYAMARWWCMTKLASMSNTASQRHPISRHPKHHPLCKGTAQVAKEQLERGVLRWRAYKELMRSKSKLRVILTFIPLPCL